MKRKLASFLFVLLAFAVTAANVTIQWDPSPDATVTGYRIYWGGASRTYTNSLDVGTNQVVTLTNLQVGGTYYFAATAYNVLGTESVFSDELVYTIPTDRPLWLQTKGKDE